MKIILNGQEHNLLKKCSALELISELGLDIRKVALEQNEHVIRRNDLEKTYINENDKIEIIEFIGGG